MKIEIEIFERGQWSTVTIGSHYRFECPFHGTEGRHGFGIEGIPEAFTFFGKDYEEGLIPCSDDKCQGKLHYRIKRIKEE